MPYSSTFLPESVDALSGHMSRPAIDKVEVESLFSMPSVKPAGAPNPFSGTTLSSKQSDKQTTRVVEELATLVVKDEVMKKLIDVALKVIVEHFGRNITRPLKGYFKDLQSEASSYPEKRAVSFVRNHARFVAKFLRGSSNSNQPR